MQSETANSRAHPLDRESEEWLHALKGSGRAFDEACARLHTLLLRAARFEATRRRAGLRSEELDVIANEAADDALLSILRKLDDFRGLSRFATWAYKFALYEAAVKLRKRAWQGREIPLDDEGWSVLADASRTDERFEQRELLERVKAGIEEALTPHQRSVLVAVVLIGVPIDVLAERLSTTRGALYKTLHDARVKLRDYVEETS